MIQFDEHSMKNHKDSKPITVCYVAYYAKSIAGAEKSLLSVMTLMRQKYNVNPVLVCEEECPVVNAARELEIPTLIYPLKSYVYSPEAVGIISFIMYPIKRIRNYLKHKEMLKFLKDNNVDLMHLNSSSVRYEWADVARRSGIPYVWHLREFLYDDHHRVIVGKRFFRRLMQHASRVIAISESVKDYWDQITGRECTVVYNGLEVDKHYQERDICGGNVVNCVITGRIVESKGQFDAVKAIHYLRNKGISDIHLTVVGFRGSNEYEDQIKRYVNENSLNDIVDLVDYTDKVLPILSTMDVGLVCSKAEAFGRVTVEYNMSGLIALGADSGGTVELIDHKKTGLLYEQGNPESLADQIEWVINNRSEAKKIAKAGQDKALTEFTIENTVQNIYRLYAEAL